jgi:hypothetical protein
MSGDSIRQKLRYLVSFFSCRRYTELASRRLDHELGCSERRVFWFHHYWCMVCRRFNRQITLINRAARQWEERARLEELCPEPSSLRPERAAAIKAALSREVRK